MTDKEDYLEDENARLRALLKQAGLDATASDVASRLQRLLLSEMHHRIKNMMAMVQSIVVQTLRSDKSRAEATAAIVSRIGALARTHDIILSSAGEGSQLMRLLEELSAPFGKDKFKIDVPAVEISSTAAVALALVTNELATNAVKYGALSVRDGRVAIVGRQDGEENDLILTWIEIGGPAVQAPTQENFGTTLIKNALPSAARHEYRPDGVFCEMRVPLPVAGG